MSNGWTPERRARQAKLIRRWRPWEHSTGPSTAAGKETVACNAWKGGTRPLLRQIAQVMKDQQEGLDPYGVNALGGGR